MPSDKPPVTTLQLRDNFPTTIPIEPRQYLPIRKWIKASWTVALLSSQLRVRLIPYHARSPLKRLKGHGLKYIDAYLDDCRFRDKSKVFR